MNTDESTSASLLSRARIDSWSRLAAPRRRSGLADCRPWILAAMFLAMGLGSSEAKIIYVNCNRGTNEPYDGSTWANAWTNLNNALSAAKVGDEIWVAAGAYTNGPSFSVKEGLLLYGGFAGGETERSQRNWSTNVTRLASRQAVVIKGGVSGTNEARLDGFTITGSAWGGINWGTAPVVIANNRIVGNKSSLDSAGISCRGARCVITNNIIAGNIQNGTTGGGLFLYYGSALVINNLIAYNSSTLAGGGIACADADILITDNTFLGNFAANEGGAIACSKGKLQVIGNRFLNNTAQQQNRQSMAYGGGGLSTFMVTNPIIANNLFLNNAAFGLSNNMTGGALRLDPGNNARVVNNTLVNNRADQAGAVHCLDTNPCLLANNLVAGNSSGIKAATNVVLQNNCVYDNRGNDYSGLPDPTGRDGNIRADPRLVLDSDFGLAHLLPDSPCRDAGNSTLALADGPDLDGQPRIQGGAVDIGAHESDGVTTTFPPPIVRVSPEGDDAQDGSTWALAKRSVQVSIDSLRPRGGELWVREGCYQESVQASALLYLYGGFAGTEPDRSQRSPAQHETILDAGRQGSVVIFQGVGTNSLLDGFTLRNGLAENGGGIFIENCSPRITHNLITQNQAHFGGGIMINENASPTILANRIVSNWVTRTSKSASDIDTSRGGGVLLYNPYQYGQPAPILAENLIADNRADDPVTPGKGGGVCGFCVGIQLINNTVLRNLSLGNGTNNPASEGPGNLHLQGILPSLVVNNIIAQGSSGPLESATFSWSTVFRNNCFFGEATNNYQGAQPFLGTNGNFFADPRLDETSGLPRLQSGSPCIDVGDDSIGWVSALDLAGGPRWRGAHIDLGAVEFVPPLRLHSPRLDPAGSFSFQLTGPEDTDFVVQSSADLRSWDTVTTNLPGTVLLTNWPGANGDRGFFRALQR